MKSEFIAPTAKAFRSRRDFGSMSSPRRQRKTEKPVEIDPVAIRICQKNRRILKALEYKAGISERHRRSKQKSPRRCCGDVGAASQASFEVLRGASAHFVSGIDSSIAAST